MRRRVDDLGVRTVVDADDHGYRIMQLHPSDTGGSFLEIDFQPGGDDPAGPWMPAGNGLAARRRTDVVDGIVAVEVQCKDPDATATRWGAITACDVADRTLRLDNATVTFVDGPLDSLIAVTLRATDGSTKGERRAICGVSFTLA